MSRRRWRWLAYLWAAPTTLVGLACLVASRARPAWRRGVIEASGSGVGWWFDIVAPGRAFEAIALGHVVLARSEATLAAVRAHERVHVRQAECWGPFFLPAYLVASVAAWACGRRAYRDNWFERQARVLGDPPSPAPAPRSAGMAVASPGAPVGRTVELTLPHRTACRRAVRKPRPHRFHQ